MTPLTRWFLGGLYLAMFAVAVPWYWPANSTWQWAGMPAWVVVSVVASIAISLLTAGLLLHGGADEERAQ